METQTIQKFAENFFNLFKFMEGKISVSTDAFSRNEFLLSRLGIDVIMTSAFRELVFPALPEIIPAFTGDIYALELLDYIEDREIYEMVKEGKKVPSMNDAVAIFKCLVMDHPKEIRSGEHPNYVYVKMGDKVLSLNMRWYPEDSQCLLDAHYLGKFSTREPENRLLIINRIPVLVIVDYSVNQST